MAAYCVTPNSLAMCVLLQYYSNPQTHPEAQIFRLGSRQALALYVLQQIKDAETFLEPSMEEIQQSLEKSFGEAGSHLAQQMAHRLSGLASPDDLITFSLQLKDLLSSPPYNAPMECESGEEEILIEPNSALGLFVRSIVLGFNKLSFEGTCRLLENLHAFLRSNHGAPPVTPSTPWPPSPFPAVGPSAGAASPGGSSSCMDAMSLDMGTPPELLDVRNRRRRSSVGGGSASKWFRYSEQGMEESEEGVGGFVERDQFRGTAASMDFSNGFSPQRDEMDTQEAAVTDGGFSFAFGPDASFFGPSKKALKFVRSKAQLEKYLDKQILAVEKDLGLIPAAELDRQLAELLKLNSNSPKVHYLRYLNFSHHGEYSSALEHLHRYFDYSAGQSTEVNGSTTKDARQGRFQAGLLSLGLLHARFGHSVESIQAINEAVRMAQQSNDNVCLAHALGALCELLSQSATSGRLPSSSSSSLLPPSCSSSSSSSQQPLHSLLIRCLRKAVELKLPPLVAFARLALAKYEMQHARPLGRNSNAFGTLPLDVFKSLRMSSHLLSDAMSAVSTLTSTSGSSSAVSTSLAGATFVSISGSISSRWMGAGAAVGSGGGRGGGSSASGGASIPAAVLRLAGSSHLLKAAAWRLYGSSPMSRISTLQFATCYRDVATNDDVCTAHIHLANDLASKKGYSAALSALRATSGKVPSQDQQRLRFAELELSHSLALNRGEVAKADFLCCEMESMAPLNPWFTVEVEVEVGMRRVKTMAAKQDFGEAAKEAQILFSKCVKAGLQIERVKILHLLAQMHQEAGSPITALPFALSSISLSQLLNLSFLEASSTVTLAEIWLTLGATKANQSQKLLEDKLPFILGHGGVELRSRCHLALANCLIASPRSESERLTETMDHLEAAAAGFDLMEAFEMCSEVYYLMALTFNKLGKEHERDRASEMFLHYKACISAKSGMLDAWNEAD